MLRASTLYVAMMFAVIAAPCLATDPVAPKHQGVGRAYDKDAGLSIVPPANWGPVKSSDAAFMTFKQVKGDGIANINIRWVKYTNTPIAQVADALKIGMPKQFKDWKCESEAQPIVDGKSSYSIVSHYSVQSNGQPLDLRSLQYFIPTDRGRAYIITCTSTAKMFDSIKGNFEKSAGSVHTD